MQKELDGNANVKDHPLAREGYTNDLALTFYRQAELESIRTVIKAVANKEHKRVTVEFIG